jgi:hypothetical protein
MNQGIHIELKPLDDDHVRASIRWREQDIGGGTLLVELPVRNRHALPKSHAPPKSDDELLADARALAVRFARAFADTLEAQESR